MRCSPNGGKAGSNAGVAGSSASISHSAAVFFLGMRAWRLRDSAKRADYPQIRIYRIYSTPLLGESQSETVEFPIGEPDFVQLHKFRAAFLRIAAKKRNRYGRFTQGGNWSVRGFLPARGVGQALPGLPMNAAGIHVAVPATGRMASASTLGRSVSRACRGE